MDFIERLSTAGNAIASVCFHSNQVTFDLDFCMCMGYDHWRVERQDQGQGHTWKEKVKRRNAVGGTQILNWGEFESLK